MWLPLRYKEVNYIPWFIIWKLKTHSFSNLIPPSMEQCSLWAKLANNVTNSDADVISIRGAAARRDERVPDGSLPLLSPRLDNSPAVVIITWAIKEGEAVLACSSHLILHLIVFLSFPVSLCQLTLRSSTQENRVSCVLSMWNCINTRTPNNLHNYCCLLQYKKVIAINLLLKTWLNAG